LGCHPPPGERGGILQTADKMKRIFEKEDFNREPIF